MANNNRTVPVKPISEIEVKAEVSENDKILILDSESEEARLASKDELKWDKWDKGDTWPQWPKWDKGNTWDKWDKWDTWASIVAAEFQTNDIVFTKDDANTVTLTNAKQQLKGDKWEKWDKWDTWTDAWEYMTQAQYDALPDSKLTDWISRAVWDEAVPHLRTLLREANNILHYNDEDELYADMQFEDWLTPVSTFPIWVSVWNVDNADWWSQDWLLINVLTADWEYVRWLYWDDGKLYFDGWTWTFSQIATTADITSALASLRTELSTVAFSWKSSDLNNDAWFTSDLVMTYEEYEELWPWTATDDVRYFITD